MCISRILARVYRDFVWISLSLVCHAPDRMQFQRHSSPNKQFGCVRAFVGFMFEFTFGEKHSKVLLNQSERIGFVFQFHRFYHTNSHHFCVSKMSGTFVSPKFTQLIHLNKSSGVEFIEHFSSSGEFHAKTQFVCKVMGISVETMATLMYIA